MFWSERACRPPKLPGPPKGASKSPANTPCEKRASAPKSNLELRLRPSRLKLWTVSLCPLMYGAMNMNPNPGTETLGLKLCNPIS